MSFSNYISDLGQSAMDFESAWLNSKTIWSDAKYRGYPLPSNHYNLSMQQLIGSDIRKGLFMYGEQDLFGALRWIIWKVGGGKEKHQEIMKKYLQPIEVKGKVRPFIELDILYDQMHLELFANTVELWEWYVNIHYSNNKKINIITYRRLTYIEQLESSHFIVRVKMNVYTSNLAKLCNKLQLQPKTRNQDWYDYTFKSIITR